MKLTAFIFALALTAHAQEQPVRVSAGVMAPQVVRKVMPQFPKEARRAHVNGTVVMHVIIGTDGTVKQLSVVSGPQMLQQAYMDAVKQWVYHPYQLNGRPVEVDTTIGLSMQMGSFDEPSERIHISSGVLASLLLTHPSPAYPRDSTAWHVSGGTVIDVIVGKDGHVLQTTIISGPPVRTPYELEAVKQWTYKPYLLNGQPVEVESTVTFQPSFGG